MNTEIFVISLEKVTPEVTLLKWKSQLPIKNQQLSSPHSRGKQVESYHMKRNQKINFKKAVSHTF